MLQRLEGVGGTVTAKLTAGAFRKITHMAKVLLNVFQVLPDGLPEQRQIMKTLSFGLDICCDPIVLPVVFLHISVSVQSHVRKESLISTHNFSKLVSIFVNGRTVGCKDFFHYKRIDE